LVVMQRPEVHALINQLLDNFRATQKIMVNVEGRFLVLRESNLEEIGVEWQGLEPTQLNGDFGDISGALPGDDAAHPIPYPGFTKTPTNVNNATFGTVGAITTGSNMRSYSNDAESLSSRMEGVAGAGLNMQLTVLSDPQYQAFLHAMHGRESYSTLLTPRLTVYNTQRAHMFVANQYNYVADYEVSGDTFDPLIRQFLSGVVLDVRPTVSSDRRYVTLEMRPAQVEFTNLRIRYMVQFVNVGANADGDTLMTNVTLPMEFPELSIRRVRTTATVPDGGVLFLAGLHKNIKFSNENGIPFLSDLPVVGRLFRWNTDESVRSNLAILVSPRIILFHEEEAKL
jgi:type II secretory pathway component GspD/PulD (secretin)